MKLLFDEWEDIKKFLAGKKILLFLDFDGTLAAIVDHYKSATILQESKALLRQLVKDPKCFVAVVSGRALSDVRKRVGLKDIMYAGNHGLEVAGPGLAYTSFVGSEVQSLLRKIARDLEKHLGGIKGLLIEDKRLTLSVHYRRVDRQQVALLKTIFWEVIRPYLQTRRVDLSIGKEVFEIKPAVKWNKGAVVLWLIKHMRKNGQGRKTFPVFIGDDVTDETAFIALKRRGLCIRVGCAKVSAAQYCLKDINHVARFLKTVLDLKN